MIKNDSQNKNQFKNKSTNAIGYGISKVTTCRYCHGKAIYHISLTGGDPYLEPFDVHTQGGLHGDYCTNEMNPYLTTKNPLYSKKGNIARKEISSGNTRILIV